MRTRSRNHRSRAGLALLLAVTAVGAAAAQELPRLHSDREPISISTVEGGMSVVEMLKAMGEAFEIDVVFDPRMRDFQVELSVRGLGPEEAFDRVSVAAGLMWVALDERSVVFAEDNPQMRRMYEPQVVQTFYLEHAEGRDVMTVLRSMIGVRNVAAQEALNALTVRDTAERIALARRLVEQHDRAPAVLEVDARLVRLSAEAMERVFGGEVPPSRLAADRARELEAAGRLLARPTLSFADGEEARLEIRGAGESDELLDFGLALTGRLAASARTIRLDAAIEGVSAGEPAPERRRLESTVRLEPGETWLVGGLLQLPGADPANPEHLVLLLTPRVAAPSSVQAADREPLAVGTESRLRLESSD